MKKTYINPQIMIVRVNQRTAILQGSMKLYGDYGHGTFYGDATGDGEALVKQNTYSVWSDDWSDDE